MVNEPDRRSSAALVHFVRVGEIDETTVRKRLRTGPLQDAFLKLRCIDADPIAGNQHVECDSKRGNEAPSRTVSLH